MAAEVASWDSPRILLASGWPFPPAPRMLAVTVGSERRRQDDVIADAARPDPADDRVDRAVRPRPTRAGRPRPRRSRRLRRGAPLLPVSERTAQPSVARRLRRAAQLRPDRGGARAGR